MRFTAPLLWAAALVVMATTGCATQTRNLGVAAPGLPVRVELADTPFFPQELHQCGPASLATGLAAAGYPADPLQLGAQVFLPFRMGSLQTEMLAAARRQGALALQAPATLAGLFAEVAAGTPVIILQNLGLGIAPRWHYAVLIGYDLARSEVILRSGPHRRERMAMATFEHTWARSDYWGMMVLRAGALPLTADRPAVEKMLTQLEKFAAPAALLAWYQQAGLRWPDSLALSIGLGNAAYASGQLAQSEQAFRLAIDRHPNSAVAMNNLATVLQQRSQLDEALAIAERAVAVGDEWQPQALATRDAIRRAIEVPARPYPPAATGHGHGQPAH